MPPSGLHPSCPDVMGLLRGLQVRNVSMKGLGVLLKRGDLPVDVEEGQTLCSLLRQLS